MEFKAVAVCDLLDREYGVAKREPRGSPLDELILTILSQNTTARNCRTAFENLRARFADWEAAARASAAEIADAIRSGGLADIKARRIKAILSRIGESGSYDLSWMLDAQVDQVRTYLESFQGVGRKTAACVLMFSLGKPVLPVDTHVYRVSWRVGLIPRVGAERAHDLLGEQVPQQRVYSFHVNMVRHGRQVCKARNPFHDRCVLSGICDYLSRSRATDAMNGPPRE